MTTVAEIAAEAFDAVAAELPDTIKTGVFTRRTATSHDPTTDKVTNTSVTQNCRLVFASVDAAEDLFPELVLGASDELVYAEGTGAFVPKEADNLVSQGQAFKVVKARDLLRASGLHALIIRGA